MDGNGYGQDTQVRENGTKEIRPLTSEDINIIRARFAKKRKIVYYFMAGLFSIGSFISLIAIYSETSTVNRLNSGLEEVLFHVYYPELLIPFFVGAGLALFLVLVLIMFKQELNLELQNNRKWILKGVVTGRVETSTRSGVAGDRDNYSDYYIRLGDVTFEHKDLYFEVGEGDRIDVQVSEKLNIVLSKNIIKNPDVAAMTQQQAGSIFDAADAQKASTITVPMTGDELSSLKKLKQHRQRRILYVAAVFIIGLGVTCEIVLYYDKYTWDQVLMMRLGFWGIPMAFFGLLLYLRAGLISKDIQSGKKLIITERLVDKGIFSSERAGNTTYTIRGLSERTEVSKDVYDNLTAGESYEVHKTKARGRLLSVVIPSAGIIYKNPVIFPDTGN